MRLLNALLPLLLFVPYLPANAQWYGQRDPAYLFQRLAGQMQQSTADSAAFARFGEAMAQTTLDKDPLPELREYRMVWEVSCEGRTGLLRGDGTDLMSFLMDPPEKRFGVPVCCPQFYGGRYAVVQWAPPTGLVRYRYWFFERTPQNDH